MCAWTLTLLFLVPGAEPAPAVVPDFPQLIKSFREGPAEALDSATTILESTSASIPALERELASPDKFYRRRVNETISKVEAKRFEANRKRAKIWNEDGRHDFLIDHIAIGAEYKPFEEILILLELQQKLADRFEKIAPADEHRSSFGKPSLMIYPGLKEWMKTRRFPVYNDRNNVVKLLGLDHAAIFGRRCEAEIRESSGVVVVVNEEFRNKDYFADRTAHGMSNWTMSCLFANCPMRLHECFNSLVICDGDLEFDGIVKGASRSIIIANGNITMKGEGRPPRISGSMLDARGDILFGKGEPLTSFYFAGKSISFAKTAGPAKYVSENTKTPPFPVRFFDPIEYGLVAETNKNGVKLTKVEPKSPLASHFQEGDVLLVLNGKASTTAADFRRELRKSIVQQYMTVKLMRKGEPAEFDVHLPDDVPRLKAK